MKKDVSEWIWNDNARTLKEQLQYAVACEAEGYINGINDCGLEEYPALTVDAWVNYIVQGIKMQASEYFNVNGLDYRHLLFNGNNEIERTARQYVEDSEQLQTYVVRQ